MLKWELLQFTRNGGRITPRFAVMDQNLTQHAEILLNIYREAWQKKLPRTYLEENLEPFLKNPAHGKRIAGFNKADDGATVYSCCTNDGIPARWIGNATADDDLVDDTEHSDE